MARAGCFQPSSLPNSASRLTPWGLRASAQAFTARRNTALVSSSGSAILLHWLPLPARVHGARLAHAYEPPLFMRSEQREVPDFLPVAASAQSSCSRCSRLLCMRRQWRARLRGCGSGAGRALGFCSGHEPCAASLPF